MEKITILHPANDKTGDNFSSSGSDNDDDDDKRKTEIRLRGVKSNSDEPQSIRTVPTEDNTQTIPDNATGEMYSRNRIVPELTTINEDPEIIQEEVAKQLEEDVREEEGADTMPGLLWARDESSSEEEEDNDSEPQIFVRRTSGRESKPVEYHMYDKRTYQ